MLRLLERCLPIWVLPAVLCLSEKLAHAQYDYAQFTAENTQYKLNTLELLVCSRFASLAMAIIGLYGMFCFLASGGGASNDRSTTGKAENQLIIGSVCMIAVIGLVLWRWQLPYEALRR